MKKKSFFSLFIIVIAIFLSGLCVYHYGMDVQPYYEEQLGDISSGVQEIYWLEDGTIVEQLYSNSASYMVGIDLVLLGTGEDCEGTLFVQLCDVEGNIISQKRESLKEIEAGQFYPIRFLDFIDVSNYESLIIRIFVEDNNEIPGLVAISPLIDVQDNISCSVNGKLSQNNLAIAYVYGNWQYVGYEYKNNGIKETLAASILLIAVISFIIIYLIFCGKEIQYKTIIKTWMNYNNFKQVLYILWILCIFLSASAVFKIRNNEHISFGVYAFILFSVGITGYYFYLTRKKEPKQKDNIFFRLLCDKGLVIVVLCSTMIRIPLFIHIQLWDGSIYYGEIQRVCSNFEYTLAYIWENFRLCGHYTIIYTFFTSIGEFLFPNNMMGVLIVMLILTDSALICIYKMLRGYWLDLSQKEAAIGTMLISVCPLFLGLFSNISMECLLFIFTIFLLYAEYREQAVMKIVWLFSLMMTKETGLVIAGGYLVVHIFIHLRNTIKNKKNDKLRYFLSDFHVRCAIGGIIVLCVYVIKQNGLFEWFGMNQQTDANLLTDYLGILSESVPFILQKMKILFVLHFEWIPMLVITFCIIYRILRHQRMIFFSGQISFLGTLGIFMLLNGYLLYYDLGRYHIFSAVMIWLLAYIMLFKTFESCLNRFATCMVSIVVIAFLLIQNFYFIDPLTNLVFDQYDTGRGKMISTEVKGGNFGDAFTNNFRHTYLYNLIDIMLEKSEFDTDTQIIIPYKKDYLYFYAYVGYDKNQKRRVFTVLPDEEKVISINHVFWQDILDGNVDEIPEKGVMYFLPYIECSEQEYIKEVERFYYIGERKEISNWGGTLSYYVLERKM